MKSGFSECCAAQLRGLVMVIIVAVLRMGLGLLITHPLFDILLIFRPHTQWHPLLDRCRLFGGFLELTPSVESASPSVLLNEHPPSPPSIGLCSTNFYSSSQSVKHPRSY